MLESRHVVLRFCGRLLVIGGAVAYSALAPALGLGDITMHSALNQPLRADIGLVDAAGLQEGDLSVSLATADEFKRAGVERLFFLNDLKFTPILHGNHSLIRVSSNKPVKEPFLNFMVQLNQPNGRVLREYTVLIDPPGSPGIVPVTDEPDARPQSSAFPSVTPAVAPSTPAKKPATTATPAVLPPTVAPDSDVLAEQLAASVLQTQQLQTTIDELNKKIQAQDEQLAEQKKKVSELQAQLTVAPPVAPAVPAVPDTVAPTPIAVDEPEGSNWPLIIGLLALACLVLVGMVVRRRRQQEQALSGDISGLPPRQHPEPDQPAGLEAQKRGPQPSAVHPAEHQDDAPHGDVLEGVGIYLAYGRFSEAAGLLREALLKEPQRTDLAVQLLDVLGKQGDVPAYDAQESRLRDAGFDSQMLDEIRARHPKLNSVAPALVPPVVMPPVAMAPSDEFQLNLDDLSMDSNWDLVSPFEPAKSSVEPPATIEPVFSSNLHVLPDVFELPEEPQIESELEWEADADTQTLDDDFLAGFAEPGESLELEPLSLQPANPAIAGKLEQAQTCIDDGDLDSAIELLNELLKDGDEPLKQTARSLLAGIR